jgi:hypothetical protein
MPQCTPTHHNNKGKKERHESAKKGRKEKTLVN